MQYKLINLKTKEETICDKVVIDGFDYYINNEKIIVNHYYYDIHLNRLLKAVDIVKKPQLDFQNRIYYNSDGRCSKIENCRKIIATNNLNISIPRIVDEVEIIADEYFKTTSFGTTNRYNAYKKFKDGYNESQKTYRFSLEDMVEFAKWIADTKLHGFSKQLYEAMIVNKVKTIEELIEIWDKQRLKTIYYG